MKAIVYLKSGSADVMQLKEVNKPAPRDNEIRVKVFAASVTIGDVILRKANFLLLIIMRIFGFKKKVIPGHEFAGVVEATGKDVKQFKNGDHVFGTTTALTFGANAEYVCVPEEWKQGAVTLKPANLSFKEAVVIPIGGMTAVQLFKKVKIQSGQSVLVYGASGSVGCYAVQIARHFGAEVTGVCSTANIELVKSIGAEKVIDYKKDDFTKGDDTYDVIFDAVGKITSSKCKNVLKKNGKYLSVKSPTSEKTEDLLFLKELAETGEIKAVIDRQYLLEQVPDAHRYVETGRKKGNVVITVYSENKDS